MDRINGNRLWNSLMEMAKVGETPGGGSNRVELTDLDKAGRELFVQWCKESGAKVESDPIGNMFVFENGAKRGESSIIVGSHLDTTPYGGRFDGVYGVLAGLEMLRLVKENKIKMNKRLVLAVWANEEGARFSVPNLGARCFSGLMDYEKAIFIKDDKGMTVGEEVKRLNVGGARVPIKHDEIAGYFELHIEQGPILEKQKCQIGVVLGINGVSAFDIIVSGESCHTATTPLDVRKDPLLGAANIIRGVNVIGRDLEPNGRGSSSWINVVPNVHNCVADAVHLKADVRHRELDGLEKAEKALKNMVEKCCVDGELTYTMKNYWRAEPLRFHSECINAVRQAAIDWGGQWMEIMGGAAHDACSLLTVVPTGMIFVPCENGVSHNERENLSFNDAVVGAEVLANTIENFDRRNKGN